MAYTFGRSFAETEDPSDPLNRLARLQMIREKQQQYPGRQPGGSGLTGLNPMDAGGWSDMLNEQTEAENIEREFGDKGPLTVEADYGQAPASLGDSPNWWMSADPTGPLSRIPLSLQGLQRPRTRR